MKGIHRVVIQNKRIRYAFELRRNLTVLRGDSATGKTTLIEMIQEFINNGEDSCGFDICGHVLASGAACPGIGGTGISSGENCRCFHVTANPRHVLYSESEE